MKRLFTILSLLTFVVSSSIGQIAYQGFEQDVNDTWAITLSTPACSNGGDEWNYQTSLSTLSPHVGTQFWGISDLNGNCGAAAGETIDFASTNVAGYINVSINFDYNVIGLDNGDDIFYTVTIDGTPQAEVNLVDGSSNFTTGMYVAENITIPDGTTTVGFQLRFTQNGGDYIAIDDVVLNGTIPSANAEINVQSSTSISIPNGDMTPSTGEDTDFGTVELGMTSTNTLTIQNTGGADLTTGAITISGTDMADFAITNYTAGIIGAGGDTTFDIEFTPSSLGVKNATVSIVNDDADENPYTFDITGEGFSLEEVAITEFLTNPVGDEATFQYVEIYNYGATPVDLNGWKLKDEDSDVDDISTASLILEAGEYLLLVSNKAENETAWFNGIPCDKVIEIGSYSLANGADEIILENNLGQTVWSLAYQNDDNEGRATHYTEATFTNRFWGSKTTPGVNRTGNDVTGTLGYERNNATTDPLVATSTNGNMGSPLNGTSCPPDIYTSLAAACETSDVTTSTGSGVWQYITLNGEVIAAFNDNGNVMGDMTADVFINTGAVRENNDNVAYMDRSIYINPTTQPSSSVDVRFYFTATELADFLAASAEASTIGDIVVTKTSGISCTGSFQGGDVGVLTPSSNMTYRNGHYLEMSVISFSGFFPHGGATPLPVELIDFNLTSIEEEMILRWTTASEENSDKFVIERSYDGISFEAIGDEKAQGNSNEEVAYQFIDSDLADVTTVYYRLRQIDLDGTEAFSEIRSAKLEKDRIVFSLSPNPTKDNINLNLGTNDITALVQIIDITGKIVHTQNINASGSQEINTESLAQGVYFLNINSGGENVTLKFTKR